MSNAAAAAPDLDTLRHALDDKAKDHKRLCDEIQAKQRKQTQLRTAVPETVETRYPEIRFREALASQAEPDKCVTSRPTLSSYGVAAPRLELTDEQDEKRRLLEQRLARDVSVADDSFRNELSGRLYEWHRVFAARENENCFNAAQSGWVESVTGAIRCTFSLITELARQNGTDRRNAALWARERILLVLVEHWNPRGMLDHIAILDCLPEGVLPQDLFENADTLEWEIVATVDRLVENELLIAMPESPRADEATSFNHSEEQTPAATVEPAQAATEAALHPWAAAQDNGTRSDEQTRDSTTELFPRSTQRRAIAGILLLEPNASVKRILEVLDCQNTSVPEGWERAGWNWNYGEGEHKKHIDSMISKVKAILIKRGRRRRNS